MRNLGRRIVLGAALGALVYAALVAYADLSEIGRAMGAFRWGAFGAALGLAFTNYLLRFVKWEIYRRQLSIDLGVGESFTVYLAGFSMSVTPAKLGEVLRSFLLKERRGVPIATSAPIVLADRLTDLVALILLAAFGTLAFRLGVGLLVAGTAMAALVVVTVGVRPVGRRLGRLLGRLPVLRRRADSMEEMFRSAYALCRLPNLVVPTILAVAAWFAECVAFYLIVNAFAGTAVDLEASVFVYSAATIAGAVAMVPGGVGVAEGGMTGLLMMLVVSMRPGVASCATILVRLATLWFAVIVGLVALAALRFGRPPAGAAT